MSRFRVRYVLIKNESIVDPSMYMRTITVICPFLIYIQDVSSLACIRIIFPTIPTTNADVAIPKSSFSSKNP